MPTIDILLAFTATTVAFAFIPGPAMFYAAARTLAGGRRAGLMAALGIHLGAYVHVAITAAGLSLLLRAVPVAYLAVKLAGAAYLIWLGVCLFRKGEDQLEASTVSAPGKAFLQSVTVEILNPKTAIFFTAFLPQFVNANNAFPVWLQFALLGCAVNFIFTVADIVSVLLASVIVGRTKSSRSLQSFVRRIGGTIMIGLGARIATGHS